MLRERPARPPRINPLKSGCRGENIHAAQKGEILRGMAEKRWPKGEPGGIRPAICRVFPIQRAGEARRMTAGGRNAGKIVLTAR